MAPIFSGVMDSLDGVICPSLYHVSVVQPEAVRSLARVVRYSLLQALSSACPRRTQRGWASNGLRGLVWGSAEW